MPSILFSTSAAFLPLASSGLRGSPRCRARHGAFGLAARSAASTTSRIASASSAPAQAAPTMARSSRRRGLKMPGVSTNTIWVSPAHRDAAHRHARGLHLGADDGDLRADQRVDERGLAGIGRADDGAKAAALCHGSPTCASSLAAASCSASRLEPPSPVSGVIAVHRRFDRETRRMVGAVARRSRV